MSEARVMRKLTYEEIIAAQRACVDLHVELENNHQVDRIIPETFSAVEPIYYDVVPGSAHYEGANGPESIRDFYDMLFGALPDIHITYSHEYDVPGYSIREGIVTGTHSADFGGIPASGRKVVLPFCGIYIFGEDPNMLISERAYWDNDGFMRQMRGELVLSPDMPWHKTK